MLDGFDHHFTIRTIKVIFDGSLGSRSAALLQPYSDAETSGFLTEKEADLRPMLRKPCAAASRSRRTPSATAPIAPSSIFTKKRSKRFRLTTAK